MKTDQELQETIAANVTRLRGDRSYNEIARLCTTDEWKCYSATIQQIEASQHMPGTGVIMRIAAGLGVTPNELLLPHKASAIKRRGAISTTAKASA